MFELCALKRVTFSRPTWKYNGGGGTRSFVSFSGVLSSTSTHSLIKRPTAPPISRPGGIERLHVICWAHHTRKRFCNEGWFCYVNLPLVSYSFAGRTTQSRKEVTDGGAGNGGAAAFISTREINKSRANGRLFQNYVVPREDHSSQSSSNK